MKYLHSIQQLLTNSEKVICQNDRAPNACEKLGKFQQIQAYILTFTMQYMVDQMKSQCLSSFNNERSEKLSTRMMTS